MGTKITKIGVACGDAGAAPGAEVLSITDVDRAFCGGTSSARMRRCSVMRGNVRCSSRSWSSAACVGVRCTIDRTAHQHFLLRDTLLKVQDRVEGERERRETSTNCSVPSARRAREEMLQGLLLAVHSVPVGERPVLYVEGPPHEGATDLALSVAPASRTAISTRFGMGW